METLSTNAEDLSTKKLDLVDLFGLSTWFVLFGFNGHAVLVSVAVRMLTSCLFGLERLTIVSGAFGRELEK